MKNLYTLIFSILLIFGSCQSAKAKRCIKEEASKYCVIDILDVSPTQFSLGMLSIPKKIEEVEQAFDNDKIKKYLKSKIAPTVIGPDGNFYILDRHHTSYAILHSKIPNEFKVLYLDIIEDWSKLSFKEFIQKMKLHNYTWLIDREQNFREFKELPKSIDKLDDDPYRSLAWKVRKEDGFKKVKVPYLEFYWGKFFYEEGIRIKTSSESEIKKKLPEAIELARSNKAKHLPGFKD